MSPPVRRAGSRGGRRGGTLWRPFRILALSPSSAASAQRMPRRRSAAAAFWPRPPETTGWPETV